VGYEFFRSLAQAFINEADIFVTPETLLGNAFLTNEGKNWKTLATIQTHYDILRGV
jgi:hypothetical protein